MRPASEECKIGVYTYSWATNQDGASSSDHTEQARAGAEVDKAVRGADAASGRRATVTPAARCRGMVRRPRLEGIPVGERGVPKKKVVSLACVEHIPFVQFDPAMRPAVTAVAFGASLY